MRKGINRIRHADIVYNDKVYIGGSEGSLDGRLAHDLLQPPIMHESEFAVRVRAEQNFNEFSKIFSYRLLGNEKTIELVSSAVNMQVRCNRRRCNRKRNIWEYKRGVTCGHKRSKMRRW